MPPPTGGVVDAAQVDGLHQALETARSKMLEAQAKSDVLQRRVEELEKGVQEQNALHEIRTKELREKRMRQVAGRIMGKTASDAFEAWIAAVNTGDGGGEARPDDGKLEQATLRIKELESENASLRSTRPGGKSAGGGVDGLHPLTCTVTWSAAINAVDGGGEALTKASQKIAELQNTIAVLQSFRGEQRTASLTIDKVSAVKEQNLNLYAEQRALCQQRDAAMETNITMEHQLNTLGEKSEFSEKELRNQKLRFIHGRLRNKGLAWIFQTWASVSLNGTWKELAVAKRKRVLLKQKLLQATRIFAQSPSVEGEKQVRSTREVLEAEDARIQKQEALLFEKERLEEIDRRASRGSPKQEPRDRIKNVFERRARNKQNINSVLTRFKDAHKIRVRRRLRCVHSAKFDASSAVQKFGALQKNVQAFDTWRCAIIERKQCVETQKDPEERANTMEEDFEAFLNNDPDQRLLSTAWNSTQFQAKQNIADYRYGQTHMQYSLIT